MSGTDHGAIEDWQGPSPVTILVRPQMGENIGAAARAMWNFGLDRLRIVDPRDGWPNPKAVAMASGAGQVLDHAGVVQNVEEAIADLNFVFATTARERDLTKPVLTPERAMEKARSLISQGQKVGIIYGPERAGLENSDLVHAGALISVPVNPAFASLNLAQCVLLVSYEWRRQSAEVDPELLEYGRTRLATGLEIQKLIENLESRLERVNFFWPEHKRGSMEEAIRNLFNRVGLTEAETRLMHGIVKYLADREPLPERTQTPNLPQSED